MKIKLQTALFIFVLFLNSSVWACSAHEKQEEGLYKKNTSSHFSGIKPPKCEDITYKVTRNGDNISIVASGENNTTGYTNYLIEKTTEMMPPEYELVQKEPEGPAGQKITPFVAMTVSTVTKPTDIIVVYDHCGRHEIKIKEK